MKKLTSYIDFGIPYLFFLLLLVASLPYARFGMSFAQFGILGLWFLEGEFRRKIRDLVRNKAALVLVSFYLIHLLGLLYSSDLEYGLKDIRIKLPLLFLPVVFATSERLRRQNIDLILMVYLASVLVASLISLYIRFTEEISDFRQLSPFISHIRLSLNVCLAIFFSLYYAFKKYRGRWAIQLFFTGISIWLLLFLVMLESVTGIIILMVGGIILLAYQLAKGKRRSIKAVVLAGLIIIPVGIGLYIRNLAVDYFVPGNPPVDQLDKYSAQGNLYWHDTVYQPVENGSWIGLYISEEEVRQAWNNRSDLDYEGKDEKGHRLKFTLFRYMNSRGLRKDSAGMEKMSDQDIRNVEMGVANYEYTRKFSLKSRLYKIFWEYQIKQLGMNPGGHSVIQRLEYWKAAWGIISDHFLVGVGTGDVRNAFIRQYKASQSVLEPQFQHRAHNQYLAIFVAFGVIGFLWFIFTLVYPPVHLKKMYTYHYFVFWLTMVISMLVEDSLETQVGVTLFAFFNTFLLFAVEKEKKKVV